MLKQFIADIKAGFEDGPDIFCLYNYFSLFFLAIYAIMFAAVTGGLVVLCGMLFYSILTLSFSLNIDFFALSSAGTVLLLAVWFLLKYATCKLWIISLKRHPFLRFPCPPS